MVMGSVKPDQGRIKTGETVVFGYYSQEPARISPEKRVIDVVKDIAEYVETGNGNWMNVSQFLNHFLFKGSKQHTLVSKLSGGELKRLHLLTILLRNPNFLILDEPTNDLDITTLNILEEFLADYQGCMLLVTHDRYFMDRLVDHVFVLDGTGNIKDIHGNYSAYRQIDRIAAASEKAATSAAQPVKQAKEKKQKLSYKEQKEFEDLEVAISDLEARKAELETIMSGADSTPEDILKASHEYSENEKVMNQKTDRWMELAAKSEG
jgi:ATP-binding cassette subfamily F protein uup